jgi:hypothetical protein
MNIFQILAICGMLAPIIYTLMWIIGGHLDDEYSHVRKDVSSLIAIGAPNKGMLDKFIISSSILLFAFFVGVHMGVNNGVGSIIGPLLFIIASFLGVLVALFFPLDEGGTFVTTSGRLHVGFITLSGILTTAGMIAMWFRLQSVAEWSSFGMFSLTTAIVSLILIVVTVKATSSNYLGLAERFMVSTYQIYYFVFALLVFLAN